MPAHGISRHALSQRALARTLLKLVLRGTPHSIARRTVLRGLAGTAGLAALTAGSAAPRALRVGIVGGGIVGASIAMHLARRGARVSLFERLAPASGATQNSFAWVNAFVADAHYRDLRLQSMAAYRRLDAELGLGMVWGGYVNWGADAHDAETVRENAADFDGSPYAVRPLDAAQLAAGNPALAIGAVSAAFYSAIDGHLDPVKVTQRFLQEARAHDAQILYPCTVEALELRGARLQGVRTSRGPVALDRLVIAAGVDAPQLLAMVGYTLPLRHAPGILAHSVATGPLIRSIYDAPGALSFKQMADGSVVGTDAAEPPDLPAHALIRLHPVDFPPALRAQHGRRILDKIGTYLPGARDVALERLTLGYRPMPRDEFPVLGALSAVPDVHVAVTHSGVTLAPIIGMLSANETLMGIREAVLSPYRPERFAGVMPAA